MFRRPAALVRVGFLFCAVRCRASLWSCLACLPVFWALPWIQLLPFLTFISLVTLGRSVRQRLCSLFRGNGFHL